MKKLLLLLGALLMTSFIHAQNTFQTDTLYMNISVQQADTLIQNHVADTNFIIIDVRTPSEYNGGYIEDAININYYAANFGAILDTLDKNKIYLVYCGSGNRSAKARDTMIAKHFVTVYNMLGGVSAWTTAGYSLNMPTTVAENFSVNSINIYPNPVSDVSSVDASGIPGTKVMSIFNSCGEMIRSSIINGSAPVLIESNDFEEGMYFIRITNEQNTSIIKKIMITK